MIPLTKLETGGKARIAELSGERRYLSRITSIGLNFIFATTDPHKVPVTVLSRCLQFVLRNMTAQQVSQHLAHVLDSEQIPYETPALALLGRAAAGSMRDALSLLDQAIAMGSGNVTEADVRQMIGAVD